MNTDNRRNFTAPRPADQLRLVARVARMYHEQDMRQGEIAERMHLSQPTVSRLLKSAVDLGIVRTVVTIPDHVHADLEERLERAYGLDEVVIADIGSADEPPQGAVGEATARYLESTIVAGDRIGVSAWSENLIAASSAIRAVRGLRATSVVQLVGGLGSPRAQMSATRMMDRFAQVFDAEPVFLPTPAVLGSATTRADLLADHTLDGVVAEWDSLTVTLVGVGSIQPSRMLTESGNIFRPEDQRRLREAGAVGDVCLRYFDSGGRVIDSEFDTRVVGATPEQLLAVPRRVAVAGEISKAEAMRAALRGGWATVLITSSLLAERLLSTSTPPKE